MEIRTDKELVGSDPSLNEENQVNICFIEAGCRMPVNKSEF